VGERRLAGAEAQVRLAFDAELRLQRRLHVDLAEDAEALFLEQRLHAFYGLVNRQIADDGLSIRRLP
jgi:hypothetical protein